MSYIYHGYWEIFYDENVRDCFIAQPYNYIS